MTGQIASKRLMVAASAIICFLVQPVWAQLLWAKPIKSGAGKDAIMQEVTVVHQNTEVLGKCDIYLSENAGRCVAQNNDMIMAASAPSWNILIYSRQKNQGCVITPTDAKADSLGMFGSSLGIGDGKAYPGHDAALGLDYIKIVMVAGSKAKAESDSMFFQDRMKRVLTESTLKVAKPCKISPPLQRFLNYLYNLNTYTGLPLELKNSFKDGTTDTPFSTLSIEHTKKPASFFAYPTGFKRAAGKVEVLFTQEARDTLEELWGSVPKKGK